MQKLENNIYSLFPQMKGLGNGTPICMLIILLNIATQLYSMPNIKRGMYFRL